MVEFLFLVAFSMVLFVTGISIVGIIAAFIVGFVVMALAGMVGVVIKMLPWIILIAIIIWVLRGRDNVAKKCRNFCNKQSDRFRNNR